MASRINCGVSSFPSRGRYPWFARELNTDGDGLERSLEEESRRRRRPTDGSSGGQHLKLMQQLARCGRSMGGTA
ncbi:hypothetical protein L917_20067 [Phytophthora nicotianae]|uniref:Uncharacterized protein n=2 Tax=Phytophthora nicotianae TaxID=4792 RepID=W2K283_PHYNI|nr:hypothetical protein L917_20067 [Phytophthora nicotianae]